MSIIQTERLSIRELDSAIDAEFIFALLYAPMFIQFIGDRGVRSVGDAGVFIEERYRQSYRDNGYGLYAVTLRSDNSQVGMCGFVKRDNFEFPDIGFAFLPEYERMGYGFESAAAVLDHGREELGFRRVLAITSLDNDASGRLLEKLGFGFVRITAMPDGDVKLYNTDLFD